MQNTADSIAKTVADLRKRSGLSMAEIAKLMGYNGASSYQRYEDATKLKDGYLKRDWVELFARAVVRKGTPPITEREVWALAGPEFSPERKPRAVFDTFDPDAEWRPTPDFDGEAYTREMWTPKQPGALPEVDLKLGAGEGAVGDVLVLEYKGQAYSGHRIVNEWLFPESFLHSTGTSPTQSIIGEISGDSMIPTYLPGDRVVVDLSQSEMTVDGIYMWSDGQSPPQVKRFQRIPFSDPPRVEISSDNKAYRSFEAPLSEVRIFGRITWHLGRR